MIWLILGFFLRGSCSLPYLNTSLVGFDTKGQAWYSFILEPWCVFNQVNPAPCYAPHSTARKAAQSALLCAGRVRGFVAKVCILQNNCHSPAYLSYICTFCCHSNVDRQKIFLAGQKKLRRRRKCWKMRCKGGLLPSGPLDSLGRYRVGLICDYSELI